MNPLDWIALSIGLLTVVGYSWDGMDMERELHRATPAQVAQAPSAAAEVIVGGRPLMRFADSGVMAAEDRAREARMGLRRAIAHYALPGSYVGPALRVVGGGDVAELAYLDLRIATATATDAKLAGAASAHALAERWRADLDLAIRQLPSPLPDAWIVTAGRPTGTVLVSDATLASAAAASLPRDVAGRVRVSAAGGILRLEGEVASSRDKLRLARLMRDLPGCRGVDDRLGVAH